MMGLRTSALLLAFWLPVMVAGQEVVYTPFDNNGDNIVGIGDLIDLLARFGDSDLDQDGIWDSADDCVGAYDTCGVCNGPGPQVLAIDTIIITFDSIYVDAIDDWLTYELNVDTLLHLVCENPGCTDPDADNFDPYAEEGGTCIYSAFCYDPTFDGYTYEVVQIGDQCWFAENLRTMIYANGDSIPAGLADGNWTSITAGATAVYGEGSSECNAQTDDLTVFDPCNDGQSIVAYGRLYNWHAVDDARSICPVGWHVPTDGEWTILEDYITSQGHAGAEAIVLKSTSGWLSWANGNGTDDFGFSALPGGLRSANFGSFFAGGVEGTWWSSTATDGDAWIREMSYALSHIERFKINPLRGYSVRCLRDSE